MVRCNAFGAVRESGGLCGRLPNLCPFSREPRSLRSLRTGYLRGIRQGTLAGGEIVSLVGDDLPRNVVIEFDSLEQALRRYHVPEYQEATRHRPGHAEANLMTIKGIG